MSVFRAVAGFLLMAVLWNAGVLSAQAATPSPACFCYINQKGAIETGGASNAESCETICKPLAGYEGFLWANDTNQYPTSNLRCYAEEEQCKKDGDGNGIYDGVWDVGSQPAECLPGSHYCYPADQNKVTLQVEILGKTQVIDFAEYVALVYKWLLSFAFTVAVVFMMIGGIRYIIGATTGEIGKAKDMVMKSVAGFVLLLFAWVILYTVNPQLVRLQVPKLPMLRPVHVLDGDDCATILGWSSKGATPTQVASISLDASAEHGTGAIQSKLNGAVIKYGGNSECGTTAEVIKVAGGEDAIAGTTCDFSYCAQAGEACVDAGSKNVCASCEEMIADNDLGLIPSSTACGSITYPNQTVAGKQVPTNMCVYVVDLDLVDVEDTLQGTCGNIEINCNGLTSCSDYNWMSASNNEESGCVGAIGNNSLYAANRGLFGESSSFDFSAFCSSDYCGLAPAGQTCSVQQHEVLGDARFCLNSGFDPAVRDSWVDKYGQSLSAWDRISSTLSSYSCFSQ